ncbi:hypothetical protein J5289_28930 (plasmid) [Rhizobium sp. B230/85]|uniref:hypothetical protein n=1 Tax=unclassified Rhizobium TaxID=2613769 RepID=UPI001ADBE7DD|nr:MULTISPECIES: hypothetical protein [unclassified Rhizobium]MBO9136254.1 hypothetical protein [Rhizobium sp. B209b/85]QXZ99876.1 hypothetical protein J5289_28930 [Rhizobium sp. B230/85]
MTKADRQWLPADRLHCEKATLENILQVTARLAFICRLNLPRNMLSAINAA